MMKRVFEKIITGLALLGLATAASAVKINAPGDINNFAPAIVTVMGVNNAATATKWATARTITLTGSITGSCSIDGSANCSITTSGGGGVPTTRQIIAGAGLTGGGDLSADRTLAIDFTRANSWTGQQTFSVAPSVPSISIDNTSSNPRRILFTTSGSSRWGYAANTTAESGGNVGSDFQINAFSDAGSLINSTVITRATGSWSFPANISVNGAGAFVGSPLQLGSNTATSFTIAVSTAAASTRQFAFYSAGQPRWGTGVNAAAESGSNAGANFVWDRYSDAGTYIDTPMFLTRSNGQLTLSQPLNASGGTVNISGAAGTNRSFYIQTAGSVRWQFYGDSTAESGSNAGTNFSLSRYSDSGTFIDTPFVIGRASGSVSIANSLTVGGSTTVTGNVQYNNKLEGLTIIGTEAGATYTIANNAAAVQFLSAALTANRTVTLPSPGVIGTVFRFVRGLGSTGSFTWSIGGIKSLAAGTWVEIANFGAPNWAVIGSGSL